MGQSNKYKEKYKIAKQMYLNDGKSITEICKLLKMDRESFSKGLKADGIEVINKQNITKFDETFFDVIDNQIKAYWLGFLYADGAISSTNNTIEISLQSSDIGHLEKLKLHLGFDTEKHIFQDEVRSRLMFQNKHLKESLIKLGCTPKKSLTLIFPNKEIIPDEFLFDFIRGYVDGDGSVMIGKNHLGEYVKPRLSIMGTKDFLAILIERAKWRKAKIQNPSQAFCVEWGGNYVMEYLDQLYSKAEVYLDRKYEKYLTLKNCRL